MRGTRWFAVVVVALTVVALAVPSVARAQDARKVRVGGKAGWNVARVRGEALSDGGAPIDFSSGNGFSIGGLLAVAVHENITIQPELIYSAKQVSASLTDGGVSATGEIETGFFEIPVLAKFHGEQGGGARPFGLVGATFSLLTSAEQTITALGMTTTEDITDELTSSDVGLTVGGGVDFMRDWGMITVDARYTFGLRSLDDTDDVKQDTFAISAGFIF